MGFLYADTVAAMWEVGLDISSQKTKKLDPFLRERVSYVITLRDRQIEHTCPIFPGAIWRLTWPIESPALAKNREQHRAMVRRARDQSVSTLRHLCKRIVEQ